MPQPRKRLGFAPEATALLLARQRPGAAHHLHAHFATEQAVSSREENSRGAFADRMQELVASADDRADAFRESEQKQGAPRGDPGGLRCGTVHYISRQTGTRGGPAKSGRAA